MCDIVGICVGEMVGISDSVSDGNVVECLDEYIDALNLGQQIDLLLL